MKEKVDPYLRPLYDGLYTVLGREQTERFIERGIIEIAPLAYMREDAITNENVLTRFWLKMVVTGDQTQIDLPKGVKSGLKEAVSRLHNVKGISILKLDQSDVVRHPLVSKIIEHYEGEN